MTTKNFLSQFGLDTLRQLPDVEALEDAGLLAALSVNQELILSIGASAATSCTDKAMLAGGAHHDRLAADLRRDFPEMTGMRAFAEALPEREIVQQVVAQLPWGPSIKLVEGTKSSEQRLWYARQAAEQSWSRNVPAH